MTLKCNNVSNVILPHVTLDQIIDSTMLKEFYYEYNLSNIYRKRPCISRTSFHKLEAKNHECGLSTDTSVFGVLKNLIIFIKLLKMSRIHIKGTSRVADVQRLFHEWWLLAREDVCVACLLANLALQQLFQTTNFHFTRATEHQPQGISIPTHRRLQ